MLGEEAGRLDQKAGCGDGGLIGQDLAEGDPRAVIHGRVDVVIADAPSALGGGAAMDLVATAVRDAAQLLDVQVDQLPGMLTLVADDDAAGPVSVREPTHAIWPASFLTV